MLRISLQDHALCIQYRSIPKISQPPVTARVEIKELPFSNIIDFETFFQETKFITRSVMYLHI